MHDSYYPPICCGESFIFVLSAVMVLGNIDRVEEKDVTHVFQEIKRLNFFLVMGDNYG